MSTNDIILATGLGVPTAVALYLLVAGVLGRQR